MPKLYVLVGVPCSGKSTWVANQEWSDNCEIISTDFFVEKEATRLGKTCSEVFIDYMPTAVSLMAEQVILARELGKDIIWDQTSTTINSRKRKINMLPNYYAIAIEFRTPPLLELERRLNSRPGKIIPREVVEIMIAGFEPPMTKEGFNEIWHGV